LKHRRKSNWDSQCVSVSPYAKRRKIEVHGSQIESIIVPLTGGYLEKHLSRRGFLKNTTAALGATAFFASVGFSYFKDEHRGNPLGPVNNPNALPQVFFTRDLSPNGLLSIHSKVVLMRPLPGKVAIKLHSGEPGGHYYLAPTFIKDLVQSLNGTIVECDTAYPGRRYDTASHKQVMIDHGFAAIAPVDVMDENGSMSLPFSSGTRIKEDFVGSHFANYDSFLILSHFKGHAIGGFGGAFKNMSIGIASGEGKMWIHTAGVTRDRNNFAMALSAPQNPFLESMAEAAGAVMTRLGDKILYINVMNNLSVDCDCSSNPAPPTLDDIGILASLDPVALDKACLDLVYAADPQKSAPLRTRIESRNGIHTLDHAELIGLGSQQYEFVDIDQSTGVGTDTQEIPSKSMLHPAYPNPFNPSTTITYTLGSASFVDLSIYNLKGQLVDCIFKENQSGGHHSSQWNPNSISAGIYFIRLTAGTHTDVTRCIYLK
jgi:hypothetical protein